MNLYDNILSFKGTWRRYQERVLNFCDAYLSDGKIHIVAAPGAGKTTLGIELIRRKQKPCLILSPRIVIREQWLDRIKESFLNDKISSEDILSNDIKNPKTDYFYYLSDFILRNDTLCRNDGGRGNRKSGNHGFFSL